MSGDKKRNPLFGITIRRFIEGKYALGFKGDNRGPSLSYKVGYRTAGSLFFDLAAGKQFAPIVGSTSGTQFVGIGILDAISPDTFALADVSTKGSFFIGTENSVFGRIRTSASDPLVPFSPDLDTVLTFKAVIIGDLLTISGHLQGDGFTGAEVILSYKDGREFLLTHESEGTLISLGDKYLKELGKFTKKYIVDEDGFIVEELSPFDPRYQDQSNTLFDISDRPTIDVYLPPITQAYQTEEVTPVLHYDDLVWRNDEPTTDEVDSDGDGVADMSTLTPDEPDVQVDSDGDGVADMSTLTPDEPDVQVDSDGDGVADMSTTAPDGPDESDAAQDELGENAMEDSDSAKENNEDDDFEADLDEPSEDENEDDESDADPDEPEEDENEDNDFEADPDEPEITHEEPPPPVEDSPNVENYEAPPS